MRQVPRVALTVALLGMVFGPGAWPYASAADAVSAGSGASPPASAVPTPTKSAASEKAQQTFEPPTIDQRLASFDNRLTNAQDEGRLSNEQVENFRSALAKMNEEKAQHMAYVGKLSSFEEQKLALALDKLDRQFVVDMRDRKVAVSDIPARMNEIKRAIAVTAAEGRLSARDADELKAAIKSWHDKESVVMGDAQLSYTEALVLSMHLDRLIDRLGHALQQRPVLLPDFKALTNSAEQAVSANESKLPAEAATAIKKKLEEDKQAIAKLHSQPESWARTQQILSLAADLQQIQDRVALLAAGKTTAVPIAERQTQIDQSIADAVYTGVLSPNEGHHLKAELEAIIAEQKNLPADSPAASVGDQPQRIALELERLANTVAQTRHAPRLPWTGLIGYHTGLDKKIDDAEKAGRITADQSKEFKQASDALAKKAQEFRTSGGRFDAAEMLEVAIALQRVNVGLHHSMKDRGVQAPDLAALQKQLDRLIAEGVESGRLQTNESLNSKLSHIASLQQQYEKSSEGLDVRAKLAVATAIVELMSQLQGQIHRDDMHPAVSLDARLSELGQEITTAMSRGVLSVERAAQYKAALDTVYGELWNDRKKSAGLSAADSLAAANDVAVLREQLAEEVREKSTLPRQLVPRYRAVALDIGRAVAAGRISGAEADVLMNSLNRTAWSHVEAASSQGGMSHGEGLRLAYDLERISAELESRLRDEQLPVANISNKALHLDSKLANALATGKLSLKQAQQLESQLEAVLTSSAVFANSGGMSYPEALTVSIELDHVGAAIDKAEAGDKHGVDLIVRQQELQKRIKDAVTNGKLHSKDAELLKYDLDRIADSEAAFRVSDEGLNFAEALTLALNLDRVASRLESLSKGQLSLKESKGQK